MPASSLPSVATHPMPPSKKPRLPCPPTPPSWLQQPSQIFVSACQTLPNFPFDASETHHCAVSLLSPELWRRRAPWHRLVTACARLKPPLVDGLRAVNQSLARMLFASIEAMPRASRRGAGRNVAVMANQQALLHPQMASAVLHLILDLAFPLYDMAAFCRAFPSHSHPFDALPPAILQLPLAHAVLDAVDTEENAPHFAFHLHSLVPKLLQLILKRSDHHHLSSISDSIRHVVCVLEALLTHVQAPRWYTSYSSPRTLRSRTLKRIANSFLTNLPLHAVPSPCPVPLTHLDQHVDRWLTYAFSPHRWRFWADLADDLASYMPESHATARAVDVLCDDILDALLLDVKHDDSRMDVTVSERVKQRLKMLLNLAVSLDGFYLSFCEMYDSHAVTAPDIQEIVNLYEKIVQQFDAIRNHLLVSGPREKAMIAWTARSLIVAKYYRNALLGDSRMCNDLERGIQSLFAEASWSKETRAMRFMVHRPYIIDASKFKQGATMPIPQQFHFWVATLDFTDPINQAIAIVPWDPHRALKLLDAAIGLTPSVLKQVLSGKKGVTLWDFRRIEICRLVMRRGSFPQAVLIMERLQVLFDQKHLHEGGNFSPESLAVLRDAAKDENLCAQTAQGLLLAGEGTYWEVARCWAGCEKDTLQGVKLLYAAAMAGDLEACTALSHIWAQCGSVDTDVFRGFAREQIFALFKIAVTSQNPQAVLNMGVMFRYGLFSLTPDAYVAVDAFLMALQGAVLSEARSVAAKHLMGNFDEKQTDVLRMLAEFVEDKTVADCITKESPNRIGDFVKK